MSGSLSSEAEPWGQLVRLDCEGDGDRFPFSTDEVKIGRAPECDLSFPSSLYLSGLHCCLVRDKGGRVHLKDSSTNGTLVDGKKVKREQVEIQDGAVIKLVSHPEKPADNIIYTFHDLRPQGCRPTSEGLTLEATVQYPIGEGERAGDGTGAGSKRPKKEKSSDVPPAKVPSTGEYLQCATATQTESGSSMDPVDDGGSGSNAPPPDEDHMGENLICGICQEVFHDCVSLQPCMHCYCAGCYSGWMARASNCPECRGVVERINHNHMINKLVESYLKLYPEKKRSDEDLKELDAKNKIDKDMLYPQRKKWHVDEYSLSDNDSIDSHDSHNSLPPSPVMSITLRGTVGGEEHTTFIALSSTVGGKGNTTLRAAPASLCRQCPGATVPASSSGVTPPPYTCPPFGNHVMCQCCMEPMPVRGADEEGLPPQHCSVCQMSFCHLYWGCRKPSCVGCLNKYRDATIFSLYLDSIVLNNSFESQVLKDYLSSKGKEVQEFFEECMGRLQDGTYSVHDHRGRPLTPDTVTCCHCMIKYLRELAYLYRKDIPDTELPSSVTGRPNCYYGKNCRTQSHSYDHASRYNHICEQTVF